MQSFARRSIHEKFLFLLCGVAISSTLGLAQHPFGPPVHPPAPTVRMPSPPMLRTPMYQPPILHAPVIHAPVTFAPMYAPPRNPVIPPFHPKRPVIFIYNPAFALNASFWQPNFCWWTACDLFWPATFGYTTVASPSPTNYVTQVYENPVYVYGYEREDTPQLYLKDGTVLNVTDYWVIDAQLHFTAIEQIGAKPTEHSMPFEELDLQKTIDANGARGFRFVLRNEPFEQYVRDHPEGSPPAAVPPRQ
ncbi:MAG TPA: hypothetical protein VJQ54_00420 [Candidatus Sulfotelmatobacter sp.]|nr:hypothetical protein [Candidatus Sulfotelmatobacter sp.]